MEMMVCETVFVAEATEMGNEEPKINVNGEKIVSI